MSARGGWVATEADDDIRRNGIGLDADDEHWAPVPVPGHWRDTPKFATSDGPLMYRHHFTAAPPAEGRRRWVTFDGIFYQADAWMDGAYLGDPEGYFYPHAFDITALARLGDEHVLAVEVTCAPQSGQRKRRNITGVFQQWEGLDREWNPGGLWRPVRFYETGPTRIGRLRVLCRDADERRAHILLATRLDSDTHRTVTVRTLLDGVIADEQQQAIAVGDNELEWSVDIVDPDLWWPRAMGDQPLVQVAVEVEVDGERSDRRERRTGLRQVAWNDWIYSINGERLFLKGANLLPTTVGLANADPAAVRRDVQSAADLGLDALRVYGHIGHRELYLAADELGLLLLQDFPLLGGHARSVRDQAVAQARAAVDTLGHHPSIIQWTAHNDPGETGAAAGEGMRQRAQRLARQQLPTWNRSVLDRWVKRSLERADSSRPTIAQSGTVPHLPQLDGTDSHLWYGWRTGQPTDLAVHAARLPRRVRFVSEFGADSVPTSAEFLDEQLRAHRWPDLDWERLAADHGYDRTVFERLFPPVDYPTFEAWQATTQSYQAHVLKVQIETLRRLKYRPTGGFCFSRLADPAPLISSSILDHRRVRKDAFETVRMACAAVLIVADPPPDWVTPGQALALDVHVISDLRHEIDFAVVDATASWAGGERRWRFGGPIPADEVVGVGVVAMTVPDTLGELTIELTLVAGEIRSTNRYATAVTLPPD